MKKRLKGIATSLRSVEMSDAEFIAQLRSDPDNHQFLSSDSIVTVEQQEKWLMNNVSTNAGYYFIIENRISRKRTGTISIYNLDYTYGTGEFGRYICTDPLNAIESELLLLEFTFNKLLLNNIYCRTDCLNQKVWKQHYQFGFKDELIEKYVNGRLLKRQTITREMFINFDYSKIRQIIKRIVSK
jgi:RimJ/RimL family protein N-acetyltransferase